MFITLPLLALLPKLSSPLVLVALASIALYASGRFLFRRDEAVEDRRRKAIKLAGDCQKCGLDFLAPVLEDYSVGDYSGMTHRLQDEPQRRKIIEALEATAAPNATTINPSGVTS